MSNQHEQNKFISNKQSFLQQLLNKEQLCPRIVLLYAIYDTIYSFFIVYKTGQAAFQSGVDISPLYTKAILVNTLAIWVVAIGLNFKNITGYCVAILANTLLITIGFNKLSIEWQEAPLFYKDKFQSQIFATLKYWVEYHNGIQEIPRLVITLFVITYVTYSILFYLFKGRNALANK